MPPKTRFNKDDAKKRLREKLAVKRGVDKKICLTMIVRNEEKNMPRLLDSLVGVIDMISIVDTGSTDNTISVIKDWGRSHALPTTVHQEPFRDFAYNRTHSLNMARETYLDADYFLLSDADFIWERKPDFSKKLLLDDKYLVEQHNPIMTYWNVRLLSRKYQFVCKGVTHEYWGECPGQDTSALRTTKLTTISIDDKEDGGCKQDKFPRDERLLRAGIEDPETPPDLRMRYYFYLAQTLRDMGKHEESKEYYQKRIDCGHWYEEVYYAMYQLGKNSEALGNKEQDSVKKNEWHDLAMSEYVKAYEYRPSRAEALYSAARLARFRGKNEECYRLASLGRKIPMSTDTLFVEKPCYGYIFDYEISVVAFYLPEKKIEGMRACERLLARDDISDSLRDNIEKNSRFYV